jgi:hypothetical protein
MFKRIGFALMVVLITLLLAGCNFKTNVRNSGLPQNNIKTLAFYNGGLLIGQWENASLAYEIVTSKKIFGADIYFYKYHVRGIGINDTPNDLWIADSEALMFTWTE